MLKSIETAFEIRRFMLFVSSTIGSFAWLKTRGHLAVVFWWI